ncbi:Skp1-domain-containing protein, partial [Ramicandelaber brevisporus]
LLGDCGESSEALPLATINGPTLAKVLEYCQHQQYKRQQRRARAQAERERVALMSGDSSAPMDLDSDSNDNYGSGGEEVDGSSAAERWLVEQQRPTLGGRRQQAMPGPDGAPAEDMPLAVDRTIDRPLENAPTAAADARYRQRVAKYGLDGPEDPDELNRIAPTSAELDEWDIEFFKVDQATLFDLIMAANYLEVRSLLMKACTAVANMMRGKTAEEMREHFGVKSDFTPEEYEHVKAQFAWMDGMQS